MIKYLEIIAEIILNEKKIETFEGLDSHFLLNKPNNLSTKVVQTNNEVILIPKDYLNFLNNYDGGVLFAIEDICGYKLFSKQELFSENLFFREQSGLTIPNNIVLFCHCIGDDAEYIGFKFSDEVNYVVIHCIMDEKSNDWLQIDNSFEEFITNLINNKGRKYWYSD